MFKISLNLGKGISPNRLLKYFPADARLPAL